ncbi:MAG: YafY family transcriptional regulator [Anaerolineales bacterium]|nr:YafY family transcriptional regulator [Anaerolineales bacterium]MCW5854467.1 YafY family transcriptional regulator [Anaerolineales bacterium]
MRSDRLISLVLRLQHAGFVAVDVLASEFGVSRRTILRDVESLSLAGIPIYSQPGPGGGLALMEGYRLSLSNLNEDELRAFYLAGNLKKLADLGLDSAAESVLAKIGANLSPPQFAVLQKVQQRVFIDSTWWIDDSPPPFLELLLGAVNEDRCLSVLYAASGQAPRKRRLEAYGLVSKGGNWYLVARRDGEFRTYRVSRFQSVAVLDERFERQVDFDLRAYWLSSVQALMHSLLSYRYSLRIHKRKQDFVRRHATGSYQITEPDKQGWFVAEFSAEDQETAMMLVLGLGPDAQILGPPDLLEAVQQRIALLAARPN